MNWREQECRWNGFEGQRIQYWNYILIDSNIIRLLMCMWMCNCIVCKVHGICKTLRFHCRGIAWCWCCCHCYIQFIWTMYENDSNGISRIYILNYIIGMPLCNKSRLAFFFLSPTPWWLLNVERETQFSMKMCFLRANGNLNSLSNDRCIGSTYTHRTFSISFELFLSSSVIEEHDGNSNKKKILESFPLRW